jgi:hypothetical protein
MSISNNGPISEKLLSDKATCGIINFEVKAYFELGWKGREEVRLP